MILVNEKVKHIIFGVGIITEVKDNKISVKFEEKIGNKTFLYPDAFEKFLEAADLEVENSILDELHKKQEQLEMERLERACIYTELEEKAIKSTTTRRRTAKNKA